MAGKVKNKIVEAAWELFYEKGYDNTTIDDIIRRSGTSKGSFYYHFDSKDAFLGTLSTILDEKYEELYREMDPAMNSFDKLLYLNLKMHEMLEQKVNVDLLASLYSTQLVAKEGNLLDQNRIYYRMIGSIIEEGQKRGQISGERSVSELTKYYALCERALVTEWCLHRGGYSLAEYSHEYFPVMLEHFRVC
ncbi:MAG TPA: TetR/AcrR family transcriptional regulator [Lachnospiraceae bacterium]|nr:TetR/AcrR family transcriptional regulator [Lachnospiraceae bacterium]